ncbi:hypothetical protein GL50803_0060194 [Giardia duodenalis]|uniref:Uncharacterized protein n=1 Tax=Giardia intestinalis (strain ATCC 50803 / WB clone C6) TaxID=184922 RepID=A0A644F8E8_GIAIC|nr:hypothetical protein GL50803_0060194 [Giardia intestinalis]KAE8304909.1 hypothetical protein GL50803_0060194 [Giardia intestinalis]
MRLDGLAVESLHAGQARALPLLLVQRSPGAAQRRMLRFSGLLRPGSDLEHRKRAHECFTRSHERRGLSAVSSGAHCTRGPRSPGVGAHPRRGAALRSALDELGALVLSSAQPRGLGRATGRQESHLSPLAGLEGVPVDARAGVHGLALLPRTRPTF